MMDDSTDNQRRRRILTVSATVAGLAGAGALSVPFIRSLQPSGRARAAGGPLKVDVSGLGAGEQMTQSWRGKPVWFLRRTPQMLERLESPGLQQRLRDPASRVASQQPSYAANTVRSIEPELFVVIGICTHLGCVPTFRPEVGAPDLGRDWPGGYFCPCHGSRFDLAGRVFKGVPAPTNLVVPPYHYVDDQFIELGVDPGDT